MGYTTEFEGNFKLTPTATPEQIKYLNTFSRTRRMKRDVNILQKLYKGEYGFNGSYGREGEYFAKDDGDYGQTRDESVIDFNEPPCNPEVTLENFNNDYKKKEKLIEDGIAVPGLWCQWVLTEDGKELEWDGNEKFYNYVPWLKYLIEHFFEVWGIKLNGEVKWEGEDHKDVGKIIVKDNKVEVKKGKIVYR